MIVVVDCCARIVLCCPAIYDDRGASGYVFVGVLIVLAVGSIAAMMDLIHVPYFPDIHP